MRVRLNIEYKDIIKQVGLRRSDFTPTRDGHLQLQRSSLMHICAREFELLTTCDSVSLTFEHNDTKTVGAYPESVTFKENDMAEESAEWLRSNSGPTGSPIIGASRRAGGKHVTF